MASITTDSKAFTDPRYAFLGKKMGTSRFDALGRVQHLWSYCTDRETYFMEKEVIDLITEFDGFADLLCEKHVDLAEKTDKGFRIKGTKGKIEWKANLRKYSEKGGKKTRAKWKAKAGPTGLPEQGLVAVPTGLPEQGLVAVPNAMQFNSIQFNAIQCNAIQEEVLIPSSEELESRNQVPKEEEEFLEPKKVLSSIQKPEAISATERFESRFSDFHKSFVTKYSKLVGGDKMFAEMIAAKAQLAFQSDMANFDRWFAEIKTGKAKTMSPAERRRWFKKATTSEIEMRLAHLQGAQ